MNKPITICKVLECNMPHDAKGYCADHYYRWRKYGSPYGGIRNRAQKGDIDSFIKKATQYTEKECLIWPYAKNSEGYGNIGRNKKNYLVHRIICIAVNGEPFSDNMEAAHECGNGHNGCVNPMHLKWKSRGDNARDMIKHGTSQTGTKQHMARLNDAAVKSIRFLSGVMTHEQLAKQYGVSRATVSLAAAGKTWRHVK